MGAYKWWILSFSFSLAFSTFCFFSSKCDCAKYVPNFFINFQLENWNQFWQKNVDLIRKNYLNWKRWIEQVDFSQQNSWFFWPFYFSLGFLITIKQYDCCYSRNTVVAYEKMIFGAKSAVNEPMNCQLLVKILSMGPQEMRNLWNNVTSPVYCIIKMI